MRSEDIEQQNAEHDLLEYLIEFGCLEGPAEGIARRVLAGAKLTGKQPEIFQEYVADKYFHLKCSGCDSEMPTSEVVAALAEDDGLCSWCRKMRTNQD